MRRALAGMIILLSAACSVTVPVRTTEGSLSVAAICSRVPYLAAVRDGSMTFQVQNAAQANDSIKVLVEQAHGYVSFESQRNGTSAIMYELTILAPSASIGDLMSDIEKLAMKVLVKEQTIKDITKDIINAEVQLLDKLVEKRMVNGLTDDPEIDSLQTYLNGLCTGTLRRKLQLHFYQRL